MNTSYNTLTLVAKFIGFLVIFTLLSFLSAIVFVDFWTWFIVPLGGIPTIGYAHAYGLLIFICLLMHRIDYTIHELMKIDISFAFFIVLFLQLSAWGLGAVAHAYMT